MRLYVLCKAMRWTHLPNGGGLYDQDPGLLDDWYVIMEVEAQEDKKRREKEKQKQAQQQRRTMSRRRGRR